MSSVVIFVEWVINIASFENNLSWILRLKLQKLLNEVLIFLEHKINKKRISELVTENGISSCKTILHKFSRDF